MITNLLASHPDVCWLSGETHEVFYSKPRKKVDKWVRRFFYFSVQISSGRDVFGRECLEERRRISKLVMRYVDLLFYMDKLTTDRNDYKFDEVKVFTERSEALPFSGKERQWRGNGEQPVFSDISRRHIYCTCEERTSPL